MSDKVKNDANQTESSVARPTSPDRTRVELIRNIRENLVFMSVQGKFDSRIEKTEGTHQIAEFHAIQANTPSEPLFPNNRQDSLVDLHQYSQSTRNMNDLYSDTRNNDLSVRDQGRVFVFTARPKQLEPFTKYQVELQNLHPEMLETGSPNDKEISQYKEIKDRIAQKDLDMSSLTLVTIGGWQTPNPNIADLRFLDRYCPMNISLLLPNTSADKIKQLFESPAQNKENMDLLLSQLLGVNNVRRVDVQSTPLRDKVSVSKEPGGIPFMPATEILIQDFRSIPVPEEHNLPGLDKSLIQYNPSNNSYIDKQRNNLQFTVVQEGENTYYYYSAEDDYYNPQTDKYQRWRNEKLEEYDTEKGWIQVKSPRDGRLSNLFNRGQ